MMFLVASTTTIMCYPFILGNNPESLEMYYINKYNTNIWSSRCFYMELAHRLTHLETLSLLQHHILPQAMCNCSEIINTASYQLIKIY